MQKYFSRKFVVALIVLLLSALVPLLYRGQEVSDTVTLAVLAIFSSIAIGYGIINVNDAKLGIAKAAGVKDQAQE